MKNKHTSIPFGWWVGVGVVLKILCLGFFSSDYQNQLFLPFVGHFVSFWDNSWQYVWQHHLMAEFPYHPLMLYIFSSGMVLIKAFSVEHVWVVNFLFKLPTLLADIGIFGLLLRAFPREKRSVFWIYFLSPVILYAAYIHSQLDLVPVVFLFSSFYCIKQQKFNRGALLFGLAACVKMNVVLFLPIFLIYLYKKAGKLKMCESLCWILGTYTFFSFPYWLSEGYRQLVLFNPKQDLFFDLSITLGHISVYVPLFVSILIYVRFLAYRKINNELLDLYAVLVISLFLLFVSPSTPAWYIWLIPFLSLFVVRYAQQNKSMIVGIYWLFNVLYILYFVFLHQGDYGDITFLVHPMDLKVSNSFLQNCLFTALEAILCCMIYCVYQIGIKSNSIYKKDKALVIGIGGDSGSGKTTLLKDIAAVLQQEMVMIEGDGDHKWERGNEHWKQHTHLDPKANALHKQIQDILQLKKWQPIYRKEYNHDTGKFEDEKKILPKTFVVLSGLHPFYLPKMRRLIDLKIYLNPDERLRQYWKVWRDTHLRGYSEKKVLDEIAKRAKDAKKYIHAQQHFADLLISYYPLQNATVNGEKFSQLGLKIALDSSINLESILTNLSEHKAKVAWDYSDDLKTQFICIASDLQGINFACLAKKNIINMEELVPFNAQFASGQRGFVQLLILKILSEKMKDSYDQRYFD